MAFLIRDQFSDANIDPLVDGSANPGPGTRDVTGALWKIINGALFGGQQPSSPTWGNSKLVYDGITRGDGVTLWALVIPSDREADLGVGWATATSVTTPLTTGHHWLVNDGYPRISVPGATVTLSGSPDGGKWGAIRGVEYLVGVTLRAQGAFYWISSFTQETNTVVQNSNDWVGIPQYPTARVLWVDDTTANTTTPMYPHIGALDVNGHGHWIDDLRVASVPSWATDAGMATFLERFTRADSTTSPGPGWVVSGGVAGVSGNKGYIVSNSGTRTFARVPNAASSADGFWRWKMTVGSTPTNQIECHFRFVDTSNWCQIDFRSGSVWIEAINAGSTNVVSNTPFSLSAGQNVDVCVVTKGNRYQLLLDGVLKIDWVQDTSNANLSGTGMGFGTWNTVAAGARWDDMMFVPSTMTLPADIQVGAGPHIFTVGSTIAADTFTAANGTALNGRTPDTGSAWSTVGTGWEINTNRARNTNTNGASVDYFAFIDCGTPDVEWQADILTPGVDDMIRVGALLRYTDANNYIYARFYMDPSQVGNDEIEIWERFAGTTKPTHKQHIGNVYALNTTYTLKCQIVGTIMHVLLNGEPIMTFACELTTGTKHGLYHGGADDGSSFDALTIKALTDPSAGVDATGTVSGDTVPVTGATTTATAGQQASSTVSVDTIAVTGASVTGSTTATGTVTAQTIPVTGGTVTGSAGTVINATGTVTADTIPITGSTVAATFDNTVTGAVAEDSVPVSGGTVTATAGQGATGIVSGDTTPVTGGLILAIDGGSVTGTVMVGIVPVSGGVITAMTGQRVTGTVTAKTIPVMGALVQAVDDLTFYGEFTGRAKMIPAWDGAASFD